MEYQGYKTREQVLALVVQCFPYLPRPEDGELMFFGDEDWVSKFLKDHMRTYRESILPSDGVRYLHSELANLSPKGIAWLLPSLLRMAVRAEKYDTLPEFLIYDLEYSDERIENLRQRYSLITEEQAKCLGAILEFFSEEYGHSISAALRTLDALLHNATLKFARR